MREGEGRKGKGESNRCLAPLGMGTSDGYWVKWGRGGEEAEKSEKLGEGGGAVRGTIKAYLLGGGRGGEGEANRYCAPLD